MGKSRYVPPGMREAGDQTVPNRIVAPGHDNRDRGGRLFGGTHRWCSDRHDDVDAAIDQFLRQRRKPTPIRVGKPCLYRCNSDLPNSRGRLAPVGRLRDCPEGAAAVGGTEGSRKPIRHILSCATAQGAHNGKAEMTTRIKAKLRADLCSMAASMFGGAAPNRQAHRMLRQHTRSGDGFIEKLSRYSDTRSNDRRFREE